MKNDDDKNSKGFIIEMSEPESVGLMPIRQEMEIMKSGDTQPKLGWTIREYVGAEIYRLEPGQPVPAIEDLQTITKKEDLTPGMEVLVPTLFDYYRMTIEKGDDDKPYATNGTTIALLEYGADDRNCWTSTCAINTRGIKHLSKETQVK